MISLSQASTGSPEPESPDSALVGAVRDAFAASPEVNTSDLLVNATDGIIRLVGTVNSLHEKHIAGRLAKEIAGVKHVQNDLVVVSYSQPSDEEIQTALDRVFGNYPERDPKKIGVRMVENGVVYLSGKSSSASEVWEAMDKAAGVVGVKDIINEIDIAPGRPVDDVSIKNTVMDALSEDPRLDPFEIDVRVEDAEVYLEGEVEDEEAVLAAGELASSVDGAARVINHIRVR